MNQRKGKWKPAAMQDSGNMSTVNFFKYAKEMLAERGEEDAAFYFEQCEEHLRSGKELTSDKGNIARILGL